MATSTRTGRDRPPPRTGRLPAEVTSFVGRRQDVAEVRRLLAAARLVTLTGVGGSGKTRLAVRVAGEMRRAFADGVWQVDLAVVEDSSLLDLAVAEVLGIRGTAGPALSDAVIDHLRDRQLLLVLDNCEHVLDACAALVDRALHASGGLRVLCTSRQSLGTVCEHVWTVDPLPVPDPAHPPAPSAAPRSAALELFAARGAAMVPGFQITADNQRTVIDICRSLDGLPLAIELAAAQLRTLSVEQLSTHLHDRFRILTTRHAIPSRHRTLQETFGWSFDLCAPRERLLWTRLSVFVDSFELDAAEYVCHDAQLPAEQILDVIAGLVDKSVLIRTELAGRTRYRLLETVRQYGLHQLRAGDDGPDGDRETTLRRRHRDWYLELCTRFDAEWFGPGQREWAERMRIEHANLRAALRFCLATPGESTAALLIAARLLYYWFGCGPHREGRYWLERALAADPAPTRARAAALRAYIHLAMIQGDQAEATAAAEEAMELARRLDDPFWLAHATADLGLRALASNDGLPGARAALSDALTRFAELGVTGPATMMARLGLAATALYEGDLERSAAICAECRADCEAHGDQWLLAYVLISAARAAWVGGDIAAADGYVRESLRLRHPIGDSLGVAASLERLGLLAAAGDGYERSALLLGAADQLWRHIGSTLYGASRWVAEHEETQRRGRKALGDAAFEEAFARGGRLGLDEAVAYALGTGAAPAGSPRDGRRGDRVGGGASPRRSAAADRPTDPAGPPEERLTRREREVAGLVAQGLSNKQIAGRLVTSQRTAETHVENILRKLEFTSRTQIATWMARWRDPHQGDAPS